MIERLETTLQKYNELEQELTKPEVLSDVKKTREYSKEMASLADIVNCYKKYKKVGKNMNNNEIITTELDNTDQEIIKQLNQNGRKSFRQ